MVFFFSFYFILKKKSIVIIAVTAFVSETSNGFVQSVVQCIFKHYTAACNMHTDCWLSLLCVKFIFFSLTLLQYYFGFFFNSSTELFCTIEVCVRFFLWTRNQIANQYFIKQRQNGSVAFFSSYFLTDVFARILSIA